MRLAASVSYRLPYFSPPLKSQQPFRDQNDVSGLEWQVTLGFTFLEDLRHIHDERLVVGFGGARFAGDLDVMFVGVIVEATRAQDGFAKCEHFIAGNLLRARNTHRANQVN